MFARLILIFTLVPIAELALLIQMGHWIGLLPTLGLVIGTGVLGAALASREGLRAWHAFQRDLSEGRLPGRSILDGLAIFVGGALLLTPGLMTDVLGFCLLLHPTRHWIQDRLIRRLGGALAEQGGPVSVRTWFRWSAPPVGPEAPGPAPKGREIEVPKGGQGGP